MATSPSEMKVSGVALISETYVCVAHTQVYFFWQKDRRVKTNSKEEEHVNRRNKKATTSRSSVLYTDDRRGTTES